MTYTVQDFPHLTGEKEVWISVVEDESEVQVNIHPWVREDPAVFIQMIDSDDWVNVILPREEFVDAILAVFPELKRAEEEK